MRLFMNLDRAQKKQFSNYVDFLRDSSRLLKALRNNLPKQKLEYKREVLEPSLQTGNMIFFFFLNW